METLPRITLSRAEVMKRVARFKDLKGFDGGLPDSTMPGCERTLYNVIGFQPPKGKGGAVTSPVGDDAARLAAIKISEGFNLGYCRAKPDDAQSFVGRNTAEQITAPRPQFHRYLLDYSPMLRIVPEHGVTPQDSLFCYPQ